MDDLIKEYEEIVTELHELNHRVANLTEHKCECGGNCKKEDDKELFTARDTVAKLTIKLHETEQSLKAAEEANQVLAKQLEELVKEKQELEEIVSIAKEKMSACQDTLTDEEREFVNFLVTTKNTQPNIIRVIKRFFL